MAHISESNYKNPNFLVAVYEGIALFQELYYSNATAQS